MLLNEKKAVDPFWIAIGFVFALLGGVLGMGFAINYAWSGNYDSRTKSLGWIMFILSFFMTIIFKNALMNHH